MSVPSHLCTHALTSVRVGATPGEAARQGGSAGFAAGVGSAPVYVEYIFIPAAAAANTGRRKGWMEGGRTAEEGRGEGGRRGEREWQYCALLCLQKEPKETHVHRNCAG